MNFASEKTADEIERDGVMLHVERRPREKVTAGADCTVTSSDGCIFIGEVDKFSEYTLGVDVRLR